MANLWRSLIILLLRIERIQNLLIFLDLILILGQAFFWDLMVLRVVTFDCFKESCHFLIYVSGLGFLDVVDWNTWWLRLNY